jgi:two-component system, chemotaxis family, response regulator Rcp1
MQKTIHLLLVEDNPGDVLLIRESLRHCSWPVDVTIAEDGTQALARLNEGIEADLIILDLNLPRMDGYALLERLGVIDIPIVVFSWATEGTQRAIDLGAREIVQKPSDFSEFVQVVCRIVEKWGRPRRANGASC